VRSREKDVHRGNSCERYHEHDVGTRIVRRQPRRHQQSILVPTDVIIHVGSTVYIIYSDEFLIFVVAATKIHHL